MPLWLPTSPFQCSWAAHAACQLTPERFIGRRRLLCPPVKPRPGVFTFLQVPTPLPRLPALLAAKEGPTGTYLGADKQVWAAGFGTQTPYFYDPPIILQQAAQKLQTLTACTKYYLQVGRSQQAQQALRLREAGLGRLAGPCLRRCGVLAVGEREAPCPRGCSVLDQGPLTPRHFPQIPYFVNFTSPKDTLICSGECQAGCAGV